MTEARIVLLNDPTRGIDVGTKQEIYQLLRALADAGTAILFYTTDYDELVGCCDRVSIMYAGGIKRELAGAAITEEIGRASCRESVCQYVSISVGAVSFQKKQIRKQTKQKN